MADFTFVENSGFSKMLFFFFEVSIIYSLKKIYAAAPHTHGSGRYARLLIYTIIANFLSISIT